MDGDLNAPQSRDLSHVTQGPGPNLLAQQTVHGERTKGWVTNVLLALSILALIAVYVGNKDKQTQAWLNGDEFNKFIAGPYADQKAKIGALELEIARINKETCPKPTR